eukprot:CAMPEP_0172750654 /NCGR_PEP_ID=MMETSP1074-20121228/150020_1 /TAXON_ID=2916 /ORGANISM="Ceratium fusus, Strain PA161109" /LENGTH=376 /DNA_ID=CAMNT_0013582825 /DNA_START=8 /DNA_END=1134 /DNA_ORIENTATION=+
MEVDPLELPVPGPAPVSLSSNAGGLQQALAPAPVPESHRGLRERGKLPPLHPCRDARTPSEAMTRPRNDALGVDGAGFVGTADGASASSDVFTQLRALQREEGLAASPERHWGNIEQHARDALESSAKSAEGGRQTDEEARHMVEATLSEADPRAIDHDGFALLHHASMYGSIEGVATLLRRKAALNIRTKVHETPLMLAAYYRHAEIVALLLAHRARSDLADWQGRTPLAAAKTSKCGNGCDNNGQAQAKCISILVERSAADNAAGSPKEVDELRQQGNEFFQKGELQEAIAAYSIGLSFEDNMGLYANRAACYLQLEKFVEAKLDAHKAVGLAGEAGHKKASWRLAKAALALGELDRAEEALGKALKLHAGDPA